MIPVAALGAFLAGATGTFPFGKAGARRRRGADAGVGPLIISTGFSAWSSGTGRVARLPRNTARELAVTLTQKPTSFDSRRCKARHAPIEEEPMMIATTKTTSIWTGRPWRTWTDRGEEDEGRNECDLGARVEESATLRRGGIVIVVVALTLLLYAARGVVGLVLDVNAPARAEAEAIIGWHGLHPASERLVFRRGRVSQLTRRRAAIVPVPSERCDHPWEDLRKQGLTP